jgi:hypothetical protein
VLFLSCLALTNNIYLLVASDNGVGSRTRSRAMEGPGFETSGSLNDPPAVSPVRGRRYAD